jgi:hypothetical protein
VLGNAQPLWIRVFDPHSPVIGRFRACWVTQAESGRVVAPATCTRRVESSNKEEDVERLHEHRLDREEVAGHHSPALRPQELAPGRTTSTRCRPEAGSPKDPPHGARPDPDAELAELALDPHAPPPRVLPAETDDEIGGLRIEGRPTSAPPSVGPLPPDELPVPPKRSVCGVIMNEAHRSRDSALLAAARNVRSRSLSSGAPDGPSEHLHLVPEDGVLELKLRHPPSSGQHPEEANEHEVGEGSQGARMLPTSVNQSRTEFWSPTGAKRNQTTQDDTKSRIRA